MPKFVIERNISGAGNLSAAELTAISQKSCEVLRELGPSVPWLHSYVTDGKVFCVYYAANESLIRKHAEMGGFPADNICRVRMLRGMQEGDGIIKIAMHFLPDVYVPCKACKGAARQPRDGGWPSWATSSSGVPRISDIGLWALSACDA